MEAMVAIRSRAGDARQEETQNNAPRKYKGWW